MAKMAGRHLIMDVISHNINLLTNESHASEYMYKITEITKMQLVTPVISMKFPFNSELVGFVKKLKEKKYNRPIN